jgi:two-component system phosphate regulon sensor histidine kinase PhoR
MVRITTKRSWKRFVKHRILYWHLWRSYLWRLTKASAPLLIAPILILLWMVALEQFPLIHALIAFMLTLSVTIVLARLYVLDLSALTYYAKHLAIDKPSLAPSLSFVSHAGELSVALSELHASWGARKMELEAALAESKLLFDTLPDVLVMVDEECTVLRANIAAYQLLGNNIIGREIYEVIPYVSLKQLLLDVLSTGQTMEVDITVAKDNRLLIYLARAVKFPVQTLGGIAGILILHNVTEARQSRQLIKDFVANASHEIRTPLTSLVGFIETLQTVAKDDPEASQRFLEIMSSQAQYMKKLVSDLLSLSKIEMNETIIPTESVALQESIVSAKDQLLWSAMQKKMNIEIIIETELPDIIGDRDELVQVFINLISNAIKYGRENTNIKVTAGVSDKIPAEARGLRGVRRAVFIAVADEGEGIAREHLPRLTERFYRVDKARTRKINGTGLGLSIVKHILNHHRGDMTVRSTLGKGSVFTVYLPMPR